MPASLSLITLAVADVARSTAFYQRLGYVKSQSASQPEITFIQAGGVVLSLFGRDALADDSTASGVWTGNGGIVLARNVASEAEVDRAIAEAEQAGARILKPPAKTFWGGYSGHFADPDDHIWEVAHNPFFPLDEAGIVTLPA